MHDLVHYLASTIPLAGHMAIEPGQLTSQWFELTAPLAPNLNYKHTAFGGSLATLCTLAGWCVISRACEEQGVDVDISVMTSQIRYQRPVNSDPIRARAYLPEVKAISLFFESLERQGKASTRVDVRIFDQAERNTPVAVEFNASYHATVLS